jgi:DNA-binding transcriptional regulator GbsR (MarR family)
MEITTLFTEQRWNILKLLSSDELSPLQLAQKSNTTIANISQQLRLLEAATLVKKVKIRNRDKGKPRTVFSLSNDHMYIVSTMSNLADKKLIAVTPYHKILLNILFVEDKEVHYYLSKLYWELEKYLDTIKAVIYISNGDEIKIAIITDKIKELEKKISVISIEKPNSQSKAVKLYFALKADLIKGLKAKKGLFSEKAKLHFIYDSENISREALKVEGDELILN